MVVHLWTRLDNGTNSGVKAEETQQTVAVSETPRKASASPVTRRRNSFRSLFKGTVFFFFRKDSRFLLSISSSSEDSHVTIV
jgi:hypothetical protein